MKLFQNKYTWFIATLLLGVGYFVSCTKNDQVINLSTATNNINMVLSLKTSTAPIIDGTIDAIWENSPKLKFEVAVPDPTGDKFRSYVGNITNVTLRSMYDNQNIYFLAEWVDPTKSLNLTPWYFDPITKIWAQETEARTFDAGGSIIRKAFGQDKFAIQWNIDSSVSGWNSATCFKSCHTGLSAADGFANHFTNNVSERIDIWDWRSASTGPNGQVFDRYIDNDYPDGKKDDDNISGGPEDNIQTLTITGTTTSIEVPKYFIPSRTNYYWILQSEIDNATAKLITAVDGNGVLYYNGGTIDPNTDVAFQRDGAGSGAKNIPGISTSVLVGSAGDISAQSIYTGSGWVVEFKRALKTADTQKQDIDFSSLTDQYFGFAVFDNAEFQHAIKTNLLLRFQK